MNYHDLIKKNIVGLIMLFALAFGVTLVTSLFIKNSPDVTYEAGSQRVVNKTEISKTRFPDKFPTNIPIEANALITENYYATSQEGYYQATRSFESTQSLAVNLVTYTKFLQDDGWSVKSTLDKPTYKSVSGSKGLHKLQISISENKIASTNTVSISLTELQ